MSFDVSRYSHATDGIHVAHALRDLRMLQSFRVYGYTRVQIQEHLGLHYSTVSMIVKRVDNALKGQEQRLDPDPSRQPL